MTTTNSPSPVPLFDPCEIVDLSRHKREPKFISPHVRKFAGSTRTEQEARGQVHPVFAASLEPFKPKDV